MKLFGYFYNPCIYESAEGLVSLHRTREGAEKAMEAGLAEDKLRWEETNAYWAEHDVTLVEAEFELVEWKVHGVREIEVLE